MKLYVIDPTSNEKHYLKQNAKNRKELTVLIGSKKFKMNHQVYNVNDVKATSNDSTAEAMALGGVIGVAGGVPGVILGGLIGALLGKGADKDDSVNVEIFNRSQV